MAQNFWLDQVAQIAPEQAQINALNMAGGIPPLLADPNAPAAPPLARTIAQAMPDMVPKKIKITERQMEGLKGYLPAAGDSGSPVTDAYTDQAKRALEDQKATLKGLNDYIDQIAAKPQGVNYTPLAAYVDSLTGSKLTAAAQSIAPMSAEEKDKMLFGLRNQLAQGQSKLSSDQLRALAEQKQMQQWTQHQLELERHNRSVEGNQLARGAGMEGRVQNQKDNQAQHAAAIFDTDPIIKTQNERRNQISIDKHTLDGGGMITPQIMDELSKGIAVALNGGKSSGLEESRKQEIRSAEKDLVAIKQYVTGKPANAISPEQKQMLYSIFERLEHGYGNVMAARADQIRKGRNYTYNPPANQVMDAKVEEYHGYSQPPTPEKIKVSNGHEMVMIDPSDLEDAVKDGFKQVP